MSGETYRIRARLVHVCGLHVKSKHYSISPRCDWCGHRSAKQREISARNRRAMGRQEAQGRPQGLAGVEVDSECTDDLNGPQIGREDFK